MELVLKGDTLGQKHRHYNKIVREACKTDPLPDLSHDNDLQVLLFIEIANKNRNVEYILEVFKSEDLLYVSKAIKRGTWLFTDPQYAHIINPEHLYTKVYPQMTFRAFNKLMLYIRLHLKDEKRVEGFYSYIKEIDTNLAFKWLQHCSVPFVENEIESYHDNIPDHLLKRLFKKSYSIFVVYCSKRPWIRVDNQFMLKKNPGMFLGTLERLENGHYLFLFTAKSTKILMEKCPQRVLNKFELHGIKLHMPTFVKYLNKLANVKDFLIKHVNNEKINHWLYQYNQIELFLEYMPKEDKFKFIKKCFIEKETIACQEHVEKDSLALYNIVSRKANTYQWYKLTPFDMAFTDLKKIISTESDPFQRTVMLEVLVSCAGRDIQHIQTILQHYCDHHTDEPFDYKIQFVNYFIAKVDIITMDSKTWNLLNQLFQSMEVFIESENNVQPCLKAIIVRSCIRREPIPDMVKTKFVFETLKEYHAQLNKQEEKDAVFGYLSQHIAIKNESLNLTIESEFNEAVTHCEHLLNLIKDWNREIHDHPCALNRIKELAKVKKQKSWSRDLSTLYNMKKSWKKALFEESIIILPTEEVLINALKHDPGLLFRNKEQVSEISCKDTVSLTRLLTKIRIYWPHSLLQDFKSMYLNRLDNPSACKALITGLCALLPQEEIINVLGKYAPSETKINGYDTDKPEVSLCKQIAKSIHKARSLPPVDRILQYAKGDYIQYALPSLNSVLSQLSSNKGRFCIPKLMDPPVPLQKLGIRCAFRILSFEELKPMFSELWASVETSPIRIVLFTHTFQFLCKEKKVSHIEDTWDLLCLFIKKLTPNENRLIYKKLSRDGKVKFWEVGRSLDDA